ncbi:hypothetical protein PAHAL_6G222200 [Panicum hallii]|uniref:Uncharacterized protein n=1 Tax=Panicum hallii TaxID=206008 RepID=A0A2S3I3Q5_9POAL|nr:uncharacterized protein LOC112897897 [Panicum hallii]PAN35618.1 hypothetical protein PAHAL_6G222200 [Panicum hallii]
MTVSGARPPSTEEEEAVAACRSKKRSSILGTLREAIRKVRFLLSSGATRWMLLARAAPRRGLSFGSRPPGLLDVEGSIVSPASSSSSRTSRSASLGTATTRSLSLASSAAAASPEAASSGGSPATSGGDSDVDRRADLFISNFRRHLEMERQVSLQLRYVRLNSWDRTSSPSSG